MKLKQLLLIAALVMPFSVGAATLTFDDAATAVLNPYSSDGYTLQGHYSSYGLNEYTKRSFFANLNRGAGDFNDGEDYLAINSASGVVVLTNDTGVLFDVISIDLGSGYHSETVDVTLEGFDASGGSIISQTFSSLVQLTSFSLIGFTGLDNLIMTGTNRYSFDNINVAVSAVPLPAAVWLFGPALLGFMGFRRKTMDTAAA